MPNTRVSRIESNLFVLYVYSQKINEVEKNRQTEI